MTQVSPPPTREVGYEAAVPGGGRPGTPSWAFFSGSQLDLTEDVPQLAWPNNVRVYHKMRTDAQIDALIKSIYLPLRRLRWMIDPNGARDEVVQDISTQINLPIKGDNDGFVQRGRRRFNFTEHMRLALLAPLVYGHMPFEIVGEIIADSLKWQLRKLAPRMPQTIQKFDVARDGGLNGIVQADPMSWHGTFMPIQNLAVYTWEKESGNWAGRSMLRPLYRYWLLKDRMLRVDAIKNERFGAGIPAGTAPQGGDPADYQKMASSIRATENGGVGLPNGGSIGVEGIRGTLPDTLASIRMYDEQMARSWLLMVLQLGQTETGSRAVGETFVDLFQDSLWGFVDWYSGVFDQHVIEDIVDWNYGTDENVPLIFAEQKDEAPLGATELAELTRAGALLIDQELQDWIRGRFNMPAYEGGAPLPTRPGNLLQSPGETPDSLGGTGAAASRRAVVRAHGNHDQSTHGNWNTGDVQDEPAEPTVDPSTGQVTLDISQMTPGIDTTAHKRKVKVPPGKEAKVGFVAGSSQTLNKPGVTGHREPNETEVRAAVDFKKIQQAWEEQTTKLVEAWGTVKAEQVDALVADIEKAVKAEDAVGLVTLDAPVLGIDVIEEHMKSAATAAIEEAVKEASRQGATVTAVTLDSIGADIAARAAATANLLARGLADAAGRQAVNRYAPGVKAADVAAAVRDKLEGLSASFLNDQLGGALTQAQNVGRFAVMSEGEATEVYASELLDDATCEFCEANDGADYGGDMSAATSDYPSGGFVDCAGGPRCRGTLIAIYGEGDEEELG